MFRYTQGALVQHCDSNDNETIQSNAHNESSMVCHSPVVKFEYRTMCFQFVLNLMTIDQCIAANSDNKN